MDYELIPTHDSHGNHCMIHMMVRRRSMSFSLFFLSKKKYFKIFYFYYSSVSAYVLHV